MYVNGSIKLSQWASYQTQQARTQMTSQSPRNVSTGKLSISYALSHMVMVSRSFGEEHVKRGTLAKTFHTRQGYPIAQSQNTHIPRILS